MFHHYINKVRDVRADGNCGFRVVAVVINLHENAWPTVQFDLMEELCIYYNQYVVMFGTKECDDVKKRLNFFENGFAPIENRMNMLEIGFLIASRYNVILHTLTTLDEVYCQPKVETLMQTNFQPKVEVVVQTQGSKSNLKVRRNPNRQVQTQTLGLD
ncbi:hypothetical protein CTI12_AA362110 [Artemisia annua]|uniref:OTU domain-containing protein n=1 Tax=Artemisia annua TaxID=35608 RepID=A0A2U1MMV2_ARTAN|nr:hypothetical protein CTI12_AA362110 [Artemisia annua]